jgi:hypothetical protein
MTVGARFNILVVLAAVYPILFVWQGLDLTDMGYWLTNYNLIFTRPEYAAFGLSCYLAQVAGGVCDLFLGRAGVIGFKLGYVAVLYATMVCVYQILKDFFSKDHVVAAIFIALIFITKSWANWISYNNLTALFYVLSALFLYKGINTGSRGAAFFAGFFIALNPFVRFPNILGLSLLALPVYYDLRTRKEGSGSFRFVSCGGGLFSGLLFVFCLMLALGHFSLYVKSITDLFHLASSNSIHSGVNLLDRFVLDHTLTLKTGGVVLAYYAALVLVSCLFRFVNHTMGKVLIGVGAGGLCYYYLSFFQELSAPWLGRGSFEFTGVLYLFLMVLFVVNILGPGKQKEEVLILLSLFVLVLAPLGSGNGIRNSIFGMWLAIPLVCCLLFQFKGIPLGRWVVVNANSLFIANTAAITIVLFYSSAAAWHYTYRDSSERETMVHGIDHPKLRGVHTTEKRAEALQQLLDVMPLYVNKGDYLLGVESVSLLYYLTDTLPYMYNSWPMLYRDSDFKAALERAEKKVEGLPVVVRPKSITANFVWPRFADTGMPFEKRFETKRRILSRFIARHNYRNIWENSFFEIWEPLTGAPSGISKFYKYDYGYDDYLKLYGNRGGHEYKVSFNTRELKTGKMDIGDGLKQLDYLSLQGIRGRFSSRIIQEPDRALLRINMEMPAEQGILQLGLTKGKRGFDVDTTKENEYVLLVRARVRPGDYFEVFIQDRQKRWHRKKVKNHYKDDQWHDYLIFKKSGGTISDMGCGVVWRPQNDDSVLDISAVNLIVGS